MPTVSDKNESECTEIQQRLLLVGYFRMSTDFGTETDRLSLNVADSKCFEHNQQ